VVVKTIKDASTSDHDFCIGVDSPTASGKTIFAGLLYDQLVGRDNIIHEERRKKIYVARLKRKHNVLRDEIKLNKLEYKLTSQKLYSYQL
jgi:hypothetical protein